MGRKPDRIPKQTVTVRLEEATHELGICEGVETALSWSAVTEMPTWATLGKNFSSVTLPQLPYAATIWLGLDGDDESRDGGVDAAKAFHAQGRKVIIDQAPEGSDWNDQFLANGAIKRVEYADV